MDTVVAVPVAVPEFIDRRALADVIPLAIPAIPFGFVVGLAITESDIPTWAGALSSPLVFAGAAQLAMITLAGTASLWAIIVAVLVINTRHVMYSAALAPAFRAQPRWMRWLAPYVLIDQVFALSILKTDLEPAAFRRYYLTAGVTLLLIWNTVVPLGMVVGPVVPDGWRLDFAPPIMFAGLVLFAINKIPAAAAAVAGGLASLASVGLRDRLGIVVGAVVGILAGVVAEAVLDRRGDVDPVDDVANMDVAP